MKKPAIGVFGGTFDPIHLGHLTVAEAVYNTLQLTAIRFIPCYQSPHKDLPIASSEERIAMLQLALQNYPNFCIDTREIQRQGISYTFDTLISLRQELPTASLYLIMSEDAFSSFTTWYKWQEILDIAQLIVTNRLNSQPVYKPELQELIDSKLATLITIEPNTISASYIRNLIKNGKNASFLLPEEVWTFISKHSIYKQL